MRREDQQHDGQGSWRLGHNGKEPDLQLCVQADAGTGSSFFLAERPARLNTALEITRIAEVELVKRDKAGDDSFHMEVPSAGGKVGMEVET